MTEKKKRGFAAMSPEKRKAIAALGGKASHGGGRKPKLVLKKDEQ
jgi:hypothetical protein